MLRWPLTENSPTCWNSSLHLSHVILTKVSSEVRTADAERLKNFRRAVTTSVQGAKPPRNYITEEQWGKLKNPNQGKSVLVHMADISLAVVLLDTDPYHAMTPLIKTALSQFSKGDKTNNISQELSERLHKLGPCQKLLTTKSNLPKITT